MELEKLPGDKYSENIRARFWITGREKGYVGIGRIELLENIARHGSISQAAQAMGMSYKKAWKLIDELNGMYDSPLIVKAKGGRAGGGSVLTPKGEELVKTFRDLESRLADFLKEASDELDVL